MEYTFIKNSEAAKDLSPEWMDAFDDIMPKWLELCVPAYNACKKRGVSFFEVSNYIDDWSNPEKFDEDGFSYILWRKPNCITKISFDGHGKWGAWDWKTLMRCEYPNLYDNYTPEYMRTATKLSDFGVYNCYFWRYMNRREPYNYVALKVRDYFRILTNDTEVLFSLGRKSYIAFDEAGRKYGDQYCYNIDG
ncbi:MAG: hypothetical protein K2M93_00235 [Muribaculaceae bacterium]|nr:hypothetical protein [Muribaculaceae bacterium]